MCQTLHLEGALPRLRAGENRLQAKYTGEFFHEFVTETACPNCRKKILDALAEKNILGGAEVDGGILWCVTELVSKEKLDEVVAIVKEVLGK